MFAQYFIPVGGVLIFIGIILTNLVGIGLISKGILVHAAVGFLTLILGTVHAFIGWKMNAWQPAPPLMISTIMISLIWLNFFNGIGKIKMPVRSHRTIGILLFLLGLVHTISGLVHSQRF